MSFNILNATGSGSSGGSNNWTLSAGNIFNTNTGSVKIGSAAGDGVNPYVVVQSNGILNHTGAYYIDETDDAAPNIKALSGVNVDSLATLMIGNDGNWGQIKMNVSDGVTQQSFRHIGTKLISTIKLDLSPIAAGSDNLIITATNAVPTTTYTAHVASTDPAGYIQIRVGANVRYLPFFT